MKKSLTFNETLLVGITMFGLFFGAGNLIFPILMGQQAGSQLWTANLGFLITAATLPAIGIAAAAISHSNNSFEMASPVCKGYGIFLTVALVISLGPAFAIPRTATVSYEIGIRPFLNPEMGTLGLFVFSALYFIVILLFSLRPGRILDWVGRYLTPAFLVFMGVLLAVAIISPMGPVQPFAPLPRYEIHPFSTGLLDGYNTMDALASVLFCVLIIDSIRTLGVSEPSQIAKESIKAGILCIIAMSVIYSALTYMGAASNNITSPQDNGGIIMALIGGYYFGVWGQILLAFIVTLACMKTAVGLITASANLFHHMFPSISVRTYTYIFVAVSFAISNIGLNMIIQASIPVLMFLYPLAITLIILALLYPLIGKSRPIYGATTLLTLIAATFDFAAALPSVISNAPAIQAYLGIAKEFLPGFEIGFGWLLPALVGFIIGCGIHIYQSKNIKNEI